MAPFGIKLPETGIDGLTEIKGSPPRQVHRYSMLDHSLLLSDQYQLSMLEAYLAQGMTETAVFEFFVRKLPARRDFLMAAGLAANATARRGGNPGPRQPGPARPRRRDDLTSIKVATAQRVLSSRR